MSDVTAASKALLDEMAANALVKVGDIVVNEETGEIVEWPEGAGDRLEALVMRCRQAQENADGWKQAEAVLKRAIGRLLDEAGVKSLTTAYGTASWRSRTDTRLPLRDFAEYAHKVELPRADVLAVVAVLGALPVSKDTEAALKETLGSDVDWLVTRSPSAPWVQIDRPRTAPPRIERIG